MSSERFTKGVLVLGAVIIGAGGSWAFVDSSSFYDEVAGYPPYNPHFLHDIGAFQLGLAATLLLALTSLGARAVVLWGVGFGTAMHSLAHFRDTDHGGRDSDPYALALLALLLLGAAILATRAKREVRPDATGAPPGGVREDQAAPQQD